jgi:uncharacterized membrane-anchored protein YhcB (DUF1043 family)
LNREKKVLAESKVIIWLSSMLILGLGILLGIIIARRSGKKDAHIQELEEQLVQSRKEMEEYRTLVNEHFMKTSELVDQMTASYRAIFMHLADGAQALSGRPPEASLKLPEDELFVPPRPPEKSMEESEVMPEAGREKVVVGTESEPGQSGQTIVGEARENTAMAAESVGEAFEAAVPPDEKKTAKTEQRGVDPEAGGKDKSA